MNYRHAFHAGNHADVLKHAALCLILRRMLRKDAPLHVLDTHAGVGVYDLTGDEAVRSPEWRDGVARLMATAETLTTGPLRALVAAMNPDGAMRVYPGSPEIVRRLLRPQDRYTGCELHPHDAAALKRRYAGAPGMQIHARDGYAAMGALLPPPERRGLVLIDPPYERPDEVEAAGAAILAAQRRFRQGVFLWWRPEKAEAAARAALADADARLTAAFGGALRLRLAVGPATTGGPLTASSLLALNPPFGFEDDAHALMRDLAAALSRPGGGARCEALGQV